MFKVMRNDSDILVLPPKYVDELRDMPDDKVSATDANIKNMVGRYTIGNISVIRDSDLHRRTLQQKLTPALGTLIPPVKDELVFALKAEVKDCKDWTPTHVTPLIINIVARVSARIFVGPELCRNAEWLYTSIHYTRNIGITRNLLRVLPPVVRPVVARLLPSYWRIYSNLSAGRRLLGPIILGRRRKAANDPKSEKPNDFLQWLIDGAKPEEGAVNDLVHRQLLVSLGSIHTTSMMCTHFFFDLCAHPEYLEPLREEMSSVLREDCGFKKTTLNRLRKLDSFLRESQRMNPPFTCKFETHPTEVFVSPFHGSLTHEHCSVIPASGTRGRHPERWNLSSCWHAPRHAGGRHGP
jgi:cytochrome P450